MEASRRLYRTIHAALGKAGVYDDDVDWMAGIVAREVERGFELRTPEVPVNASLRADLEEIARELPALERQEPEYVADYILGRLEEKWDFRVRLDWYRTGEEGER